ncbi:hypothetical protein FJTKL_09823 [Diaporthe vaccinii]|uniref:Uncharacterized protein n=1 Tax=Diaporthe vaccinii TaxID=105482 RepID=A0ABR4EM26_9PEZI
MSKNVRRDRGGIHVLERPRLTRGLYEEIKNKTIIVTAPSERLSSLGFRRPGQVRRRKVGEAGAGISVLAHLFPPWGPSRLPFRRSFHARSIAFLCRVALMARVSRRGSVFRVSTPAEQTNKAQGKTQEVLPGMSPSPSPFVCLEDCRSSFGLFHRFEIPKKYRIHR